MKKISILILTLILINGCTNNNIKKYDVIENIKLGTTNREYQKQLDSLEIKRIPFFSKQILKNLNELRNFQYSAYVTEIFRFEGESSKQRHYGILNPVFLEGTNRIIGLDVIIGHIEDAVFFEDNKITNLTLEYGKSFFNQNISNVVLNKIRDMYTTKYGKPLSNLKYEQNNYYIIEGKEMKEFVDNKNKKAQKLKWETEFLTIELFEGFPSTTSVFNNGRYFTKTQSNKSNSENYLETCVSYTCIKYRLKYNEIVKLKKISNKI